MITYSGQIITEWIQDKLHNRNDNLLQAIVGDTGSGKSYSALTLAESVDPNFNIDKVILDPVDFMQKITDRSFQSGDAIVFDEAGTSLSAYDYATVLNKALGQIFETFRNYNLYVIFTTPALNMMDAHTRRLLDIYTEVQFRNPQQKRVHATCMRVQYNPRFDQSYFKHFIMLDGSYFPIKVKEFMISLPSQELAEAYEEKKDKWQDKHNAYQLEKVKKKFGLEENGGEPNNKKDKSKLERAIEMYNEGMNYKEIAEKLDSTPGSVQSMISRNT